VVSPWIRRPTRVTHLVDHEPEGFRDVVDLDIVAPLVRLDLHLPALGLQAVALERVQEADQFFSGHDVVPAVSGAITPEAVLAETRDASGVRNLRHNMRSAAFLASVRLWLL
jgi:hypothetical protein